MNLPVYEEKKEEKRERKTRKVCESNARFPNRALNTRGAADKRKTFERHQKRRARTIKSNGMLFPSSLSFCLSRFPCRTNTLPRSRTILWCVHFDFFFSSRLKKQALQRKFVTQSDSLCSRSNSRTTRALEANTVFFFRSKTRAAFVENNVPREILRPLRVRERPHFRTQSVLVRVPLRRVQTDACESRGRFCDGDLRVEDVREGVVR